jgi:hypothetical protein
VRHAGLSVVTSPVDEVEVAAMEPLTHDANGNITAFPDHVTETCTA